MKSQPLFSWRRLLPCAFLLLAAAPAFGLDLSDEQSKPDDLALSGAFAALPDGATRYIAHADLLALPEVKSVKEEPSKGMGVHDCTILFVSDLLKHVPLKPEADCLLLRCSDKWESVYQANFINSWNPYILLKMDGKDLTDVTLPPPNEKEKLAPYYMNVSSTFSPGFDRSEYANIDPTQVIEIVAANYDAYYKPWFSGKYAKLSPEAEAGRTIFFNNCASCHQGPGGKCGGHVSTRPWEILTTYASYNQKYFVDYVRNPQKFLPDVVMPKHESFTQDTFDKLIAFLSTGSAPQD